MFKKKKLEARYFQKKKYRYKKDNKKQINAKKVWSKGKEFSID